MQIRRLREFDQWFASLRDRTGALHITRRIARLELGNAGDCKSVGQGVLEMRIDHGPGYRVYFVYRGNELVLLLCGGDKATQGRDIVRAKALAKTMEDVPYE